MDKDKENDLDLIIDYINGELSNEQKINFEERLTLENDLDESFRFQKEIRQAFVKMHTREQVKSIHEDAKLEQESIFSKNFQETTKYKSKDISNKAPAQYSILRKMAAVFIPIIFIGGLWTWFNLNSGNTKRKLVPRVMSQLSKYSIVLGNLELQSSCII